VTINVAPGGHLVSASVNDLHGMMITAAGGQFQPDKDGAAFDMSFPYTFNTLTLTGRVSPDGAISGTFHNVSMDLAGSGSNQTQDGTFDGRRKGIGGGTGSGAQSQASGNESAPSWWERQRNASDSKLCGSNEKQLDLALKMYTIDYDSVMPPKGCCWPEAVYPYLKNWDVFACPADRRRDRQGCADAHTSYTLNAALAGVNSDSVPYPAETVTLFDGRDLWGGPEAADYRHGDGLQAGYLDGHAGWPELKSSFPAKRFRP
jgi:prepilin-type processing-associated H-X9-DG protein